MPGETTPGSGSDAVTVLPLVESARHLGHAAWLERQLYELVGSWAVEAPEPAATVVLAVQADRHAARAAVWFERLPELRELPADELVQPSAAGEVLVDRLAGVQGTPTRWAVTARVVIPALADAYRSLAASLSPIADGPTLGCLRRALGDLDEEAARLASTSVGGMETMPDAAVIGALAGAVAGAGPLLGASVGFARIPPSH